MKIKIDTDGYFYILCHNYNQAKVIAQDNGLRNINKLIYVDSPYRLYGINGEGKTLYVDRSAYKKEYFHEIIERALAYRWNINYL